MIHSMTAFARTSINSPIGTLIFECRTVNHRYLEMNFRLPDQLRTFEPDLRACIKSKLARGKVDLTLMRQSDVEQTTDIELNHTLVEQLVAKTTELAKQLPNSQVNPMDILRWPGIVKTSTLDETTLKPTLIEGLANTLDKLNQARAREGTSLSTILKGHCEQLQAHVITLNERQPALQTSLQNKLKAKIADLQQTIDEDRLAQEVALLAQKADVREELDRLQSHIQETLRLLDKGGVIGRRLDFLMQEFNREANTLASKSPDKDTTAIAVNCKVLIEQMREQIQNIE